MRRYTYITTYSIQRCLMLMLMPAAATRCRHAIRYADAPLRFAVIAAIDYDTLFFERTLQHWSPDDAAADFFTPAALILFAYASPI